jgi:hypothetical protein
MGPGLSRTGSGVFSIGPGVDEWEEPKSWMTGPEVIRSKPRRWPGLCPAQCSAKRSRSWGAGGGVPDLRATSLAFRPSRLNHVQLMSARTPVQISTAPEYELRVPYRRRAGWYLSLHLTAGFSVGFQGRRQAVNQRVLTTRCQRCPAYGVLENMASRESKALPSRPSVRSVGQQSRVRSMASGEIGALQIWRC